MTFIKGKHTRGYMGHWQMDYYVDGVIDLETNEEICKEYVFKNSTIFKGKKFKLGDIILMDINVDKDKKGNVKLSYYSNVRKLSDKDAVD